VGVSDEDDQWVLVREAAELLSAATKRPVAQPAVRAYADSGHLKVWRPPATGPGHSARRISTNSITALADVMKMPPGLARDEALAALVEKNKQP